MYFNFAFLVLLFLFFLFVVYVVYRVFKIVKFKDLILLSMLFFLMLTVLFISLFFLIGGLQDYKFRCIENMQDKYNLYYKDTYCTVVSQLKILFLIVAIIINLRNWIFYYIKIGEMAYYQYQLETEMSDSMKKDKNLENIYKYSLPMTKALNFFTLSFIILNCYYYSSFIN